MKSISSLVLLALVALSLTAFAAGNAGKVTGVISGVHCGVNGMACNATHDLRRAELPGVFTKDNQFYVIANVPQAFLAQWPVKEVTVEGTVYDKEHAVDAKKISVKEGDTWRLVFEDGNIIDAMGHKEKLSAAVELDGKWYCANCAMMHKH